MFERFTEKALQVIMLAQEEARRIGHNFVGTEQILLGLIGEGSGIAFKALKALKMFIIFYLLLVILLCKNFSHLKNLSFFFTYSITLLTNF